MASALKTSYAAKSAMLDGFLTGFGATGAIVLYDGTRPTDADTAITNQDPLCVILAPPAHWSVGGSVATFVADTPNPATGDGVVGSPVMNIDHNEGIVSWFRAYYSYDTSTKTGVAAVDGLVGLSASLPNMKTGTVTLLTGMQFNISSWQMNISQPT